MRNPFHWLKLIYPNRATKYPRKLRKWNRCRLELERLEDRLTPAVRLTYGLEPAVLNLVEQVAGATAAVTISETTPGTLKIDLGGGHNVFDEGSTIARTGLIYEHPGSPAISHWATVDISAANRIPNLKTLLSGDVLNLGGITDAAGGLDNLDASARTINVTGVVDTTHLVSAGNGNVTLTADQNINLTGPAVGISTSAGTRHGWL